MDRGTVYITWLSSPLETIGKAFGGAIQRDVTTGKDGERSGWQWVLWFYLIYCILSFSVNNVASWCDKPTIR